MAARPYSEGELHRSVGELDAKVEMIREDMQGLTDDLKRCIAEQHRILQKLDKVENKLDPLPDAVAKHDGRIGKLEHFDAKLMGVVSLASLTISAVGAGLWMLIAHFSEVVAFARKLLNGGSP